MNSYIVPEKLNIFFSFRNLFPDNLFTATFRKSQTKTKPVDKINSTNTTVEEAAAVEVKKYVASVDGTNLLGENSIYTFSYVFLVSYGLFYERPRVSSCASYISSHIVDLFEPPRGKTNNVVSEQV